MLTYIVLVFKIPTYKYFATQTVTFHWLMDLSVFFENFNIFNSIWIWLPYTLHKSWNTKGQNYQYMKMPQWEIYWTWWKTAIINAWKQKVNMFSFVMTILKREKHWRRHAPFLCIYILKAKILTLQYIKEIFQRYSNEKISLFGQRKCSGSHAPLH